MPMRLVRIVSPKLTKAEIKFIATILLSQGGFLKLMAAMPEAEQKVIADSADILGRRFNQWYESFPPGADATVGRSVNANERN